MRRYRLGFACSLQEEELRQDRNGFKPDTECPGNLIRGVLVWEEYGQDCRAGEQVLDTERVEVGIMRWLVCGRHEVDCVARGEQEEDLENGIVRAVQKGPEEIYGDC